MYVYANALTVLYEDGKRISLNIDDVWDANDPIVKARPDLFSATPRKVHRTTVAPAVEQATSAPGEKRSTRRGG